MMILTTPPVLHALRLAGARPRELTALTMLLLTASCIPDYAAAPPRSLSAEPAAQLAQRPAQLVPQALVAVAPSTAVAINAAIPVSTAPNPAAHAFDLSRRAASDQNRSLDCLTAAVYYEAASESDDGQRAVAQVVLNRLRHPSYPGTVCGVVYQGPMRPGGGCQFTFTCDGALARTPSAAGWARARRVAAAALAGTVYAPVGHATHYHTRQVLPVWASSLVKSAEIGAHIFYRFGGGAGTPAAFRQAYRGGEPDPSALARRSLLAAIKPKPVELAALVEAARRAAAVAAAPVPRPGDKLPKMEQTEQGLPESTIREEYRNSGMPRADIAAAATAR